MNGLMVVWLKRLLTIQCRFLEKQRKRRYNINFFANRSKIEEALKLRH
jgi:hypothetical protein